MTNRPTRGNTLTVLCGPSGAGKSTWTAANAANAVVLTTDAFRRHRRRRLIHQVSAAKQLAPSHLRRGRDVVIDSTSARPQDRRDWLTIARQARVRARLVVFTTPLAVCLERQLERGDASVPHAVIVAQHQAIAEATFDTEGWDEILTV